MAQPPQSNDALNAKSNADVQLFNYMVATNADHPHLKAAVPVAANVIPWLSTLVKYLPAIVGAIQQFSAFLQQVWPKPTPAPAPPPIPNPFTPPPPATPAPTPAPTSSPVQP